MEIINPTIVVTFGLEAVRGVCHALGLDIPSRLGNIAGRKIAHGKMIIFPTYHLSGRTAKYNEEKEIHWKMLRKLLPTT